MSAIQGAVSYFRKVVAFAVPWARGCLPAPMVYGQVHPLYSLLTDLASFIFRLGNSGEDFGFLSDVEPVDLTRTLR